MFTILKLLQSLVKALNSDGTPGQVAAGIAFGSVLGLTPLLSLHNLLMVGAIFLLNVSVPGAIVGWLVFTPIGFLLDPVFDAVGLYLLTDVTALGSVWRGIYGMPVVPYSNFNNSVLLGSVVSWIVLAFPIYLVARVAVARYRATIYPKLQQIKLYRAVKASKVYNVYRWFRP